MTMINRCKEVLFEKLKKLCYSYMYIIFYGVIVTNTMKIFYTDPTCKVKTK